MFFFLVRSKASLFEASILVIKASNQEMNVVSRGEMGSASVMTLATVDDMTASSVTHRFLLSLGYPFEQFDMMVYEYVDTTEDYFWKLRSILRDKTLPVPRTVMTWCRGGIYRKAETELSNINQIMWLQHSDPKLVVQRMVWYGIAILRDPWAWTHFVHGLLAWTVLYHVLILLVLTYRNFRARIGDALVSISSSLAFRGVLVFLSMGMKKFWALNEFASTEVTQFTVGGRDANGAITHADLLALYLSLVAFLRKILKERINPALTVLLFELGHHFRASFLRWVPEFTQQVMAAGFTEFSQETIVSEDD